MSALSAVTALRTCPLIFTYPKRALRTCNIPESPVPLIRVLGCSLNSTGQNSYDQRYIPPLGGIGLSSILTIESFLKKPYYTKFCCLGRVLSVRRPCLGRTSAAQRRPSIMASVPGFGLSASFYDFLKVVEGFSWEFEGQVVLNRTSLTSPHEGPYNRTKALNQNYLASDFRGMQMPRQRGTVGRCGSRVVEFRVKGTVSRTKEHFAILIAGASSEGYSRTCRLRITWLSWVSVVCLGIPSLPELSTCVTVQQISKEQSRDSPWLTPYSATSGGGKDMI